MKNKKNIDLLVILYEIGNEKELLLQTPLDAGVQNGYIE